MDTLDEKVQHFSAVTGADESTARNYLEACAGNLEMAVNMHVDSTASGNEKPESNVKPGITADAAAAAVGNDSTDSEYVRAPIPKKREVLVEESPFFHRRLPHRDSPFRYDAFRDFRKETREQEAMLHSRGVSNDNSTSPSARKRRRLADLFKPPLDLIHKGTFKSAREAGQALNKWLMVNIQDANEFPCQVLNRDVWSAKAVKSIINDNFIFWQVYHDSDDGMHYTQFYPVTEYPYIALLDPRTGELLTVWHRVDAVTFCDLVTGFLSEKGELNSLHTQNARLPVSATISKAESNVVDMNEDEQIKAAIAASLAEQKPPGASPCRGDLDTSGNLSSDVETFSDSDEKSPSTSTNSVETVDIISCNTERSELACVTRTNEVKMTRNGSLSAETPFPSSSSVSKNISNDFSGVYKDSVNALKSSDISLENKDSKEEVESAKGDAVIDWKKYLGSDSDPLITMMIRLPGGKKMPLSIPCSSKLMALVHFVSCQGYSNERYELVTNFPKRKISYLDFDMTLKEAGFLPQETIFVQER